MRYVALLAVVLGTPLMSLSADPPRKKLKLIRPVAWWSSLSRASVQGPVPKPSSVLITDPASLAKWWKRLGLKNEPPRVNFETYFVLVDARTFGLDFSFGGLYVDERGNAEARGLRADPDVMNSGVHSATLGIFPRAGIKSVQGRKLPAASN